MLTTRDCDCSREAIDNWRKTVAHPRLIIIDVFGEVRQARRSRDSFYELARAAQGCGGGVLPLSEAREVSGSETARIHYAARRRGGVGGEPQLEAEILVLRQPHLM
jgi:hypothetical protein